MLLDDEIGEIIADYRRNEDKFFKRSRSDHQFSIEDDFEEHHSEFSTPDFSDLLLSKSELSSTLLALDCLTDLQREYVCRHLLDGVSLAKIAKEMGKNTKTVNEAYHAAIKK